ncbi:fibronectin type III domain-containing protein [Pseudonocardia nigra]|uniref:fibronectin type III domain-containing protein n=1 Tax=Pseudonocardia nigra TaxID=1921578 RepID=UPI001C5ED10E|nr:fibronectin type III domain-containing protein [Pseudonocardia nigra]
MTEVTPAAVPLPPFDPNDYRKRVLAAVEKRGGPDASDPFELYDLPLDRAADGDLDDATVAERVVEVWGAWQRQRDHPKYRVLVALLVEGHAQRSAELLDAGRRRLAAARVRAQREQRDAARYELLDAAISRMVQRHRGIPADKVEGLYEIGALAGLTRDEVALRLRRHRVLRADAPAVAAPGVAPERRRQVRALLEEFGRLTDAAAPPTLLALLGLDAAAMEAQVRARAEAWRARARELPPERLRAVADELLVHVAELLEPGRTAVDAYLDAVAADVADHLRPRVRAAVLVEDRLVAEDRAHLVDEALALGLDRGRATAVVAGLAAELGVPVEDRARPPAASPPPAPPRPPVRRAWEEPLKAARAALRAGRPLEAQRLVGDAQRLADTDGATPVRAVADEVAAVLADADTRWRAAATACAAHRWTDALGDLEHLRRTAADVPGPAGEDAEAVLQRARAAVERADRAVAEALAGPAAARAKALLAVLADCPGHPGALAALAEIPVAAPAWVSAARDARGGVLVLWAPSATPDVVYRVARLRPDGSWQVLGRVGGTSLDDGGAPPGVEVPVYAVAALQAGWASAETRSDAAPSRSDGSGADDGVPRAPRDVHAVRATAGTVKVRWTGGDAGADVEYRVRCLTPDGRWRVVGRTRDTSIEDGGAPSGALPVYAVSAAAGGGRSPECRSDERGA